ncbi:18086_t:CDS:2, partial [Racocetra fulgida]
GTIFALSFVFAEEVSDVITLTKANFNKIVSPEKFILVGFFEPRRPRSKILALEYEAAATALKADNIKLAKVDCTVETNLCAEYEIRGYSTLKVFKEGKPIEYTGNRKAALIISYMKRQSIPTVSDVNVDNLDTFKDINEVVIIGYWDSESQNERDIFITVAESLRNDYAFGQTEQKEAATMNEVTAPAVVLYNKFDEDKYILKSPFTKEQLETFIKAYSVPLMAEIEVENYDSYINSGLPIAFLFYENDEQRVYLGKAIEPVAKNFKGQVNFVYINASKFGRHAKNIELKQIWPAFGIYNPVENSKYPFSQSEKITTVNIQAFVSKFVKGEIPPSIKSESIPENNDGPVTILVAHTIKDIVYNKTKDVFVLFYVLAYSNSKGKIIIAKIDVFKNEIPSKFNVTGWPTIKLFKAGEKEEIADYPGDRTLENLIEFITKNTANKIKVNKNTEEEKKPIEELIAFVL